MSRRVLTDDDHRFITEWRSCQTIPCLAKALETYPSLVAGYCRDHKLDGPHGRVAWFGRDDQRGWQNPARPKKPRRVMGPEDAAFIRAWRAKQSLRNLALACGLPLGRVTKWCRMQRLAGPRGRVRKLAQRQGVSAYAVRRREQRERIKLA